MKDRLAEERKKARRLDLVVEKLERELVEVLREGGVFSHEELLSRLGIHQSEHEAVKSISKQLEILESYGLVSSSPRGWRWVK